MPAYDNEGATISMEDVRTEPRHPSVSTIAQHLAERRRELKTTKSSVNYKREHAVCVRNALKMYGSKRSPNVILDGLNMTVPKGAIYGLLGASGCGKTTLLSCIVGRRKLNSGDIFVLGGKPGTPGSGVPGPRIGYMPQEIALFGEFTIRETMIYFGWIAGMDSEEIKQRSAFMVDFLMLPDPDRPVKNLSGGQMRRVSFAAALLHNPDLLILDEPTVGVDPVLRQGIWDHLVEITKGGRTTVIITTHYIDETKQANVIGLMRGGRFLAEESPTELIRRYQAESLEDVFLKLSVLQNRGKRRRSSILADVVDKVELPAMAQNPAATNPDDTEIGEISGEFGDNVSMTSKGRPSMTPEFIPPMDMTITAPAPQKTFDKYKPMKWNHMKALIWKNASSLLRNIGLLSFIVVLPVTQMVLFCIAIGHYPEELPIAVVNYENNSTEVLCPYSKECPQNQETWEWDIANFSCRYLDFLSKKQNNLIYYETTEDAMDDAEKGKARVVMTFAANYSRSLQLRMLDNRNADPMTIENSDVHIHLDNGDKQIEWMMMRDISESFMDALQNLSLSCDLPKRVFSIPVLMNEPVFGLKVPNLTDFAGPGVILTIIYFLAVALTSGALLAERNEGILERSLVSGITGTEILFSQVVVQIVVMLVQTAIVLIIGFAAFDLSQNGPIGWVTALTLLNGFCGMTFGFVVATLCDTDRAATYMALGSFLPMMMLSGSIWPIEGMYDALRYVSYVLPLTTSTESFRAMVQRGWGMSMPTVYLGFIVTSAWILLHLTASILLLKFKRG